VDDLGPGRLQDAAHDVDRGVMAVEQRCRRDERIMFFALYSVS